MLSEVKPVSQESTGHFKRWFHDEESDLFVWYNNDNVIIGFQFAYVIDRHDKAFSWFAKKGYSHMSVDDGESFPGKSKMTPILIPDGAFDNSRVVKLFQTHFDGIDNDIAAIVTSKMSAFPAKKDKGITTAVIRRVSHAADD